MSLPPFAKLWNDPITRMSASQIHSTLGGNLTSLTNCCCVRVSHALLSNGAPITITSDYKDKNGNKYIIRVKTMKTYLKNKYGNPVNVTKSSASGKKGVIVFDCHFQDATGEKLINIKMFYNHFTTGHVDLWNGNSCAYQEYWDRATAVYLWQC